MTLLLSILKFIFTFLGVFTTWILILNTVVSVINPKIVIENGQAVEKDDKARFIIALINAISWAIVIIV